MSRDWSTAIAHAAATGVSCGCHPPLVDLLGRVSCLVELRGLEPLTPCLQRAGRLRHTVADLVLVDLHCRPNRHVVRGRCGQDCGQRPREAGWDHVLVAHRRMRDSKFRQQQEDGLRAPHVAPINALVDDLIDPAGRGWVPYVAPVYGGVNALVLCIQRDPGPMTNSRYGGSGFLCPENDDATAERFATLLDDAGIAVSAILAWNAYPWYINRMPRAAELEAGVEPLRRLLGLLLRLQVVMLHGGSARDGWRRLIRRHPDVALRLEVVPTYHTSSQAFIGPPKIRAARMAALREAFARTARILQEPTAGPSGSHRRGRASAEIGMASTQRQEDPQDPHWRGLDWTCWKQLDEAFRDRGAVPRASGVYRLRASGCPGLIYIGISDRLSSRLGGLRRARYRPDKKGHSAAACVAAYEAADKIVSVSWATVTDMDRRDLMGLEADLIAAHRQNFGSPACQFHGELLA